MDRATARALDRLLARVLKRGAHHIVVDVGRVLFADSTLSKALLLALDRLPAHGDISVVHADANMVRLLEITGVVGDPRVRVN